MGTEYAEAQSAATPQVKIYLDKEELEDGKEWEEGFCQGLGNSRVFVPLISNDALHRTLGLMQPDGRGGYADFKDNVILEWDLALALLEAPDHIQKVYQGGRQRVTG